MIRTAVIERNHSSIDLAEQAFIGALSLAGRFTAALERYFGYFGVILIGFPFLAIYTILLYVSVMFLKLAVSQLRWTVNNRITQMGHRELMENHRRVFNLKKEMESGPDTAVLTQFYLLKPIHEQLSVVLSTIAGIEQTLKKAAYPSDSTALSEEQIQRLSKTFSDFEDWSDPALDVYEEYYK